MISITGLTTEQKELCDTLWSMETIEDIMEWIDLQPLQRAQQAHVLLKLIVLEMLDESTENVYPKDAIKEINRIMAI